MNPIIQPTDTIQPLHHETVTRPYAKLYSDGVAQETIHTLRFVRFNDEGQRLYDVSADGKTFYPIPYGFDVPYDPTDKSIFMMITHARFKQ